MDKDDVVLGGALAVLVNHGLKSDNIEVRRAANTTKEIIDRKIAEVEANA